MRSIKLLFLFFGIAFSIRLLGQNGIDSSFGNNGMVKQVITLTFRGSKFVPISLQKDSQNRLYAFGNDSLMGIPKACIARCLPEGKLDTTFGNKGFLFISLVQFENNIPPLLTADGKFIYAGYQIINQKKCISLYRFLPDGNIDSSFANNGIGIYAPTYMDDIPMGMTQQNDGKIILVSKDLTTNGFIMLRLNTNGMLDSTFNETGFVKDNFSGNSSINKVLVQADGKIIVASTVYNNNYKIALARYLNNGKIDNTFGVSGKLVQSITNGNDILMDITAAYIGNITALTMSRIGNNTHALVQWNTNGGLINSFAFNGVMSLAYSANKLVTDSLGSCYTLGGNLVRKHISTGDLDTSFGVNGIYDFNKHSLGNVSTIMSVGNNFRLLGSVSNLIVYDMVIASVNNTGMPNESFGANGIFKSNVGYDSETEVLKFRALSSLSLPDGSIVLSGITNLKSILNLSLVKIFPNGTRDLSFGNNGVFQPEFSIGTDLFACNLAFSPDQLITVAASGTKASNPNNYQLQLFKLNQNGQLQTNFANNGFISSMGSIAYFPPPLAIQSNGKIILGWNGLKRFHANGILDSSFTSNISNSKRALNKIFVLRNNQLLICNDSSIFRLHENGVFDPSFANNGYLTQYYKGNCYTDYYKPQNITYEKPGSNLLISYCIEYRCGIAPPTEPSHNYSEWMRFSENGSKINSIYKSNDSSYLNPSQLAINGHSFFVKDASLLRIVNSEGLLDYSFGENGSLKGDKGILLNQIQIGSLKLFMEPLTDYRYWYVRNVFDTIYLSTIVVPEKYWLTIFSDKHSIGFGDTVQFSAESFQEIKKYHWRFPSAVRYLNGSDSNSAAPIVQFTHSGKFDISLTAELADTNLSTTNKNLIELNPYIDFKTDLSKIYRVNDNILFQSMFNGYPKGFLWQISPSLNPFVSGTDSSTQHPSIRILHAGMYSVQLNISYTDTLLVLNKPNYFQSYWPVGLNQKEHFKGLKIFPNPSNELLNIQFENPEVEFVCEIIDFQGKTLQTHLFNSRDISVLSLPSQSGIYLIRLSNMEGEIWNAKVVKE